VNTNSNKLEIKQAVEELFKVKVVSVNTMIRQGKKKRERTASAGRTVAWKRAVVTLAEGSKIDFV
ncbi:MAG: 50S ribosomal protein L23, partial [Kiritimatiellaceae bacterium]|nr:50S ribosomal protein L23 [Kiritimatiellaceae bacterium]